MDQGLVPQPWSQEKWEAILEEQRQATLEEQRQVFFVLSGNFEVIIGEAKMRWVEVSAGDLVEVPSNVKHAFRNRSQHPVIKLGVHDVQARTLLSGNRQTCGLLGQD